MRYRSKCTRRLEQIAKRTGFVSDCEKQIVTFLDNRGLDYEIKRCKTRSVYFVISIGETEFCVRVSDHEPTARSYDMSIHPGSGETVQTFRTKVSQMVAQVRGKRKYYNKRLDLHRNFKPFYGVRTSGEQKDGN